MCIRDSYWMSRYVERGENIARILDVNLQLMLDMPKLGPEEQKTLWEPVLRSTGDHEDFDEHYKVTSSENVIDFLDVYKRQPHNHPRESQGRKFRERCR